MATLECIKKVLVDSIKAMIVKEIQSFIGAMEQIQKGVFITTSTYTREAKSFAEKQRPKTSSLLTAMH